MTQVLANQRTTITKKLHKATWCKKVVTYICLPLKHHPNLGKTKLKPYIDTFCAKCNFKIISATTIQNIINSYPNNLRTIGSAKVVCHRKGVIRKSKNYKAKLAGCNSLTSMEFRFLNTGQFSIIV